jgi:hypothetical protein
VRPQGAQRPRLGPLPARGAKPHSVLASHERSDGAASPGKRHPQERQHSGGAAGRGTECRPETGLKGHPQESQHSAAARREAGPSAPGEGYRMSCARDRHRMAETRSGLESKASRARSGIGGRAHRYDCL